MRRSQSHGTPLAQETGYGATGYGNPGPSRMRAPRPDIITDFESGIENTSSPFPLTRYSSDTLYQRGYDHSYDYDNAYDTYDYNRSYSRPYDAHFKGYLHEIPTIETDIIPEEENVNTRAVLELLSLVVENIVSHPFIILRRQSQVHNDPRRLHVFPTSLAPTVFHLLKRQGIFSFWKGFSSVCLVRGMTSGVEIAISTVTQWPKETSNCDSVKSFWKHIALKCLSIAIITPFYAASLVETVESNNFKLDKPGVLEVIKGGFIRLSTWGTSNKNKMLPIYAIVIPTVAYGIAKYVFNISVKKTISNILHFRQKHLDTNESSVEIESESSVSAMMITEILFFPLETVMHRLFLQGTRTIIDDLYNGYSVLPILTTYEGFFDCYRTIVIQEGFRGLYKGFGALVLQFAVLKLVRYVIFRPPLTTSVSWLQKMKLSQIVM